jgi:hypothetical protein
LDTAITPQEIDKAIACDEYGRAINMALCLGDHGCIKKAVDAVHTEAIDFVQKSIDLRSLHILMKFLAEEIVSFYLCIFQCYQLTFALFNTDQISPYSVLLAVVFIYHKDTLIDLAGCGIDRIRYGLSGEPAESNPRRFDSREGNHDGVRFQSVSTLFPGAIRRKEDRCL